MKPFQRVRSSIAAALLTVFMLTPVPSAAAAASTDGTSGWFDCIFFQMDLIVDIAARLDKDGKLSDEDKKWLLDVQINEMTKVCTWSQIRDFFEELSKHTNWP